MKQRLKKKPRFEWKLAGAAQSKSLLIPPPLKVVFSLNGAGCSIRTFIAQDVLPSLPQREVLSAQILIRFTASDFSTLYAEPLGRE